MSKTSRKTAGSTEHEVSVSPPPLDEQDIFFQDAHGLKLCEGLAVTYELVEGEHGDWIAINIRPAEEPSLN